MKYKLTENKYPEKSTAKLKNRYFFHDSDASCYKLLTYIEYMRYNHISEMELRLAKREMDSEYFFCKEYGRSGACEHWGYTYEQTDREFTLTIEESEFINE